MGVRLCKKTKQKKTVYIFMTNARSALQDLQKCRQNNEDSNLLIFIWFVVRASGELTGSQPNAPDIVNKTTISGISDMQ